MTLTRKWWVLIWLLSWKSPSDGKLCSTFVQPTQKIPIMCHVMLSQYFHPTKNYEFLKKDATLFIAQYCSCSTFLHLFVGWFRLHNIVLHPVLDNQEHFDSNFHAKIRVLLILDCAKVYKARKLYSMPRAFVLGQAGINKFNTSD